MKQKVIWWQQHPLDHVHILCILDNHTNPLLLNFTGQMLFHRITTYLLTSCPADTVEASAVMCEKCVTALGAL